MGKCLTVLVVLRSGGGGDRRGGRRFGDPQQGADKLASRHELQRSGLRLVVGRRVGGRRAAGAEELQRQGRGMVSWKAEEGATACLHKFAGAKCRCGKDGEMETIGVAAEAGDGQVLGEGIVRKQCSHVYSPYPCPSPIHAFPP